MTDQATLGAYLRAARRRRRVSIERAAEDTRIRADFLMRMESDEFDFLAPAYVRSFLKNYARYLRIQPEPLVEEFDRRYAGTKLDTAQIASLERRAKMSPRKRLNSWAAAAIIAVGVMAGLATIGVLSSPDDGPGPRVAVIDEGSPEPTIEPAPTETATPTPEPNESTIAFSDGIELEVVASVADCWLEIYADGEQLYYKTLAVGDSETFASENRMFVRLGYPQGVELIVNGRNIGSPGGDDPIELLLPRDIRAFL